MELTKFALKVVHSQYEEMHGVLETHDKVMQYAGEYAQIQLVQANAVSKFDQRNYHIMALPLPSNQIHKLPPIRITSDMCKGAMPNMNDLRTLVDMYVHEFQQSQLKTLDTVSLCTSELAFNVCEVVRCPAADKLMGESNIVLVDIATDKGHVHKEIAAAVLLLRMFSDDIEWYLEQMETIPC
jgi:hypothetical protein